MRRLWRLGRLPPFKMRVHEAVSFVLITTSLISGKLQVKLQARSCSGKLLSLIKTWLRRLSRLPQIKTRVRRLSRPPPIKTRVRRLGRLPPNKTRVRRLVLLSPIKTRVRRLVACRQSRRGCDGSVACRHSRRGYMKLYHLFYLQLH